MEDFDRKKHWENIYQTKDLKEVSWYQSRPETSLEFFTMFDLPKTAKIIDIGGGDSLFANYLLDSGYEDITVLDISATALEKAKLRMGHERADRIKWQVADITAFHPTEKYDFWHDRAAFHFLTNEKDITDYLQTAQRSISADGVMVIGTFSEEGPKKCSGIEIKQYSESSLSKTLAHYFKKIKCVTVNHQTPFDTIQNFIFCSFRKLQSI